MSFNCITNVFTFFWYTETKKTRKCRLFLKLLRGFIIAKTSIPELDFKSSVFCKNTICIILWIKFFVLLAEKKNYTRSILLISKLYISLVIAEWLIYVVVSNMFFSFIRPTSRKKKLYMCINYWKSCILNLKLLILAFYH